MSLNSNTNLFFSKVLHVSREVTNILCELCVCIVVLHKMPKTSNLVFLHNEMRGLSDILSRFTAASEVFHFL